MTVNHAMTDSRLAAAYVISAVLDQGQSLNQVLPTHIDNNKVAERDRKLIQELCYGTLRHYFHLRSVLKRLLKKPLSPGAEIINGLLLIGLYQLAYMRIPHHAAVSATVAASHLLKRQTPWAGGLINGVLRNFIRRQSSLLAMAAKDLSSALNHPDWLLQTLQDDWPQHWQAVITANNQRPPQTLRVNLSQITRSAYLAQLATADIAASAVMATTSAIELAKPLPVSKLPGFDQGLVSVQDAAAQYACELLLHDSQSPQRVRVLDACAAPGGKTGHLLEYQPDLTLHAIDNNQQRLAKINANLTRLQLKAEVFCGDALRPDRWWDGQLYERILLDAPCSATGVIRRHPDIKVLRRATDIAALAAQQQAMLTALWPLLKPNGQLLYVTCSVLQQENSAVIEHFLAQQPNAIEQTIQGNWGRPLTVGRQILPGEHNMDGFYFARLLKSAA